LSVNYILFTLIRGFCFCSNRAFFYCCWFKFLFCFYSGQYYIVGRSFAKEFQCWCFVQSLPWIRKSEEYWCKLLRT